jgi:predicted AAA+ superfamily ATPase
VDGLYVKPNIDVYITGSNAYLLSSELGTLLTGRYYAIHILPFSFKKYLLTQEDISRTDLLFAKYMQNGMRNDRIARSKYPELCKKSYRKYYPKRCIDTP